MNKRQKEILAARLNKRVDIEKSVQIADGGGGFTESWQIFATVWASIEPLRGREDYDNSRIHGRTNYRIVIRYMPGIETKMRVNLKGRVFNINAVMNIDEANEMLELLAEEGVST